MHCLSGDSRASERIERYVSTQESRRVQGQGMCIRAGHVCRGRACVMGQGMCEGAGHV